MKTEIFWDFFDFLERKDKNVNGVSHDFAAQNQIDIGQDEGNVGCWNMYYCAECSGCYECSGIGQLVGVAQIHVEAAVLVDGDAGSAHFRPAASVFFSSKFCPSLRFSAAETSGLVAVMLRMLKKKRNARKNSPFAVAPACGRCGERTNATKIRSGTTRQIVETAIAAAKNKERWPEGRIILTSAETDRKRNKMDTAYT